ncbi:MAG: hypothetical protein ACRDA0_10020 [Cetobacterium sp.]|uniref:hypothetical protein n=1 Tax=Cetobacterium sp. TaxID=2071632 RepID=UPI003F3EECE9
MYCKSCKGDTMEIQPEFNTGKSTFKAGYEMFRVASGSWLKICTFVMFAVISLLASPIGGFFLLGLTFLAVGMKSEVYKCNQCGKLKLVTKK